MSPTLREDIGTAEQRARPWPVDGTPGITTRPSDLFHRLDCPAFHRGLDPILARAIDVSERADWRQLRRDVDRVRTGDIHVDVTGYAT